MKIVIKSADRRHSHASDPCRLHDVSALSWVEEYVDGAVSCTDVCALLGRTWRMREPSSTK